MTRDDERLVYEHLKHLQLLGRSPGTVYARSRTLDRLAAAIGPVRLPYAREADLHAWRTALTVSRGTVQCYVSHVRDFYGWVVETGIREDNPAAALPVPPQQQMPPRPIGGEDLAYALATAPARIRAWLVLAAWCGLRAREIARLRREDVLDLADPPLLIVPANGAERALRPFALAALQAVRLPRAGWVFRRRDGQPGPCQPDHITHLANQHLRESGVTDATLHRLHHWFGQTHQASKDLRVVEELLATPAPAPRRAPRRSPSAGAAAAVSALHVPR
jgi:integrase